MSIKQISHSEVSSLVSKQTSNSGFKFTKLDECLGNCSLQQCVVKTGIVCTVIFVILTIVFLSIALSMDHEKEESRNLSLIGSGFMVFAACSCFASIFAACHDLCREGPRQKQEAETGNYTRYDDMGGWGGSGI